MVYSVLNHANFFFTDYLLTLSSQMTCCVVASMNNHLQARLGDLNAGSIIARFQTLDHNLWPLIGELRESKTAFIVHGKADVTALWTHFSNLLAPWASGPNCCQGLLSISELQEGPETVHAHDVSLFNDFKGKLFAPSPGIIT